MTGKSFIDNLFYDLNRYSLLTTDTNLRVISLAWANRVIKDISGRNQHWVWLEKTSTFPTVAAQMTYDLPTDIDGNKILSLKQETTPAKLIYINQRRLDELEADPTTSSGNPLYYTLWAGDVRLWPVPSAAITMYLRYLKVITELSDSASSTTDIPTKWDEVVLDGMKVHAFRMFPSWGDSLRQKAVYENGIILMKRDNDALIDEDGISEPHGLDRNFGIPIWDKQVD